MFDSIITFLPFDQEKSLDFPLSDLFSEFLTNGVQNKG